MARGKTKKWLRAHLSDDFVKQANQQGFRSRAAYKLLEIHQKDQLLKNCKMVVDLGCAPGSWSQLARIHAPRARILGVDILDMTPLEKVEFIRGDFTAQSTFDAIVKSLGNQRADLVMSDMAPNITGIRHADQARSVALAELALELAENIIAPGGAFLVKVFHGAGVDEFKKQLADRFGSVKVRKPKASKLQSSEHYLLARNFYLV